MSDTKRVVGRPMLDEELLRGRKRNILGCALELVADRGTDNVRLRDVANKAGVSVGTLQHYFDSRDGMMRQAFEQHANGVITTAVSSVDWTTDPWSRLESFFDTVINHPDFRRRAALWMEFAAVSLRDGELRQLMNEAYESWRVPIRAAVDAGEENSSFVLTMGAEAVVATILSLIDGCEMATALEIRGSDPITVVMELKSAARALLGIGSPVSN